MAANKAPQKPKALKKGSKLASLKTAILNATKRKVGTSPTKGKAAAAKPAPAAVAKAVPGKKGAAAVPAKTTAKAATPAPGKKSAPVVAAPAPVKKPTHKPPKAEKGAKGKAKKKDTENEMRMAGPSIRISYDANGEAVCREVACDGLSTSAGYCRMHYIKNWKKVKRKELILKEGKLNQYIEELIAKYPDKYIEAIRQDLANDKDFAKVIYDLDLDESVDEFDGDGENLDSVVGDIKRDFDDDNDTGF